MDAQYEIRDPIHGFIRISEWERDILNHPALQRLRRIRQLGLFEALTVELGGMVGFVDKALGAWYRQEADALMDGKDGVKRLSKLSTIVGNLKAVKHHRIYVRMSDREQSG